MKVGGGKEKMQFFESQIVPNSQRSLVDLPTQTQNMSVLWDSDKLTDCGKMQIRY